MAKKSNDVRLHGIWYSLGIAHELKADSPQSASVGDQIEWTVPEATTALLLFPKAPLLFGTASEIIPFSGTPPKLPLTVQAGAPSGTYPYTIFAEIGGRKWQAEGDSPPEVIIP
jgi:hypothetical protein